MFCIFQLKQQKKLARRLIFGSASPRFDPGDIAISTSNEATQKIAKIICRPSWNHILEWSLEGKIPIIQAWHLKKKIVPKKIQVINPHGD